MESVRKVIFVSNCLKLLVKDENSKYLNEWLNEPYVNLPYLPGKR